MSQFLERAARILFSNKVWIVISVLLLFTYIIIQVNKDLEWRYFLGWLFVLHFIYLPVIIYERKASHSSLTKQKWMLLAYWAGSYLLIPALLFIMLQISPLSQLLDEWLNFKYLKNIEVILMVCTPTLMLVSILTKLQTQKINSRSAGGWIRKISFFKLAMVSVALLSLLLPLIASDFQQLAAGSSTLETVSAYLSAVPQIFLIYFAYYIFYYINHHLLFKKIFQKQGLLAYLIGIVGMIVILTPILTSFIRLFPVVEAYRLHPIGTGISIFDDINFIFPILVTFLSFPIIVVIEWNKKELALKELEKQKTAAELALLKQQINPHFFFNTLNNLYALSLEKAEETPETILKLSQLMRFVIYKGQSASVSVNVEISYIRDYIDLQRMRFKQNIDIQLKTEIDDNTTQVPPLLLINLVENAFKHGIEPSEKEGHIHMKMMLDQASLYFECRNSVDIKAQNTETAGMGLINLQRRLEILFPEQFVLNTGILENEYVATLSITL